MPVSRPLLLALLGAVLVGAVFFATRGQDGTSADDASVPVAPAPEADAPVPPLDKNKTSGATTTDAGEALKGAEAVRSGTFELRASATGLKLTANGRFQSRGLSEPPLFEVDLDGKIAGRTISVGAVSDGKRGYLVRDGDAVAVPKKGWDALTGLRADTAKGASTEEDFSGYSQKELDSFKFVGRETFEGTPVLHFRGPRDVAAAHDRFGDLAHLFGRTSLPSELPQQIARTANGGTLEVWVGADDHIVRRQRERVRYGGDALELDYRRDAINQPQKISAPAGASNETPTAAGWDRASFGLAFSTFALAVLSGEPSGVDQNTTPAPAPKLADEPAQRAPAKAKAPAAGSGPGAVGRALDRRQIVILFFRQRGADDDAVATAVKSQRGRRGVAVFIVRVGKAPKYERFGGSNVVRAPSIVVLGHDRQPRLFEGFIDKTTLAQAVTDLR